MQFNGTVQTNLCLHNDMCIKGDINVGFYYKCNIECLYADVMYAGATGNQFY